MSFAHEIFVCSSHSSIDTSRDYIDVTFASVLAPSKESVSECSSTIMYSIESVPRMHLSVNFVQNHEYPVKFWTNPNQFQTCRFPICRTIGIKL